jgi:hypothetical protein
MSAGNPTALLPLFAGTREPVILPARVLPGATITVTLEPIVTTRRPITAGADDAAKHLHDEAPGWVLSALGDALLSMRGRKFTSDDVRRSAGPAVDAWLTAEPERQNCFSGWWQRRVKLHRLIRCGSVPSTRKDRRGAYVTQWEFPA